MSQTDNDDDLTEASARRPRHAAKVSHEVAESIHERLAAMQVRRATDQHQCQARGTGSCDHPNHRRDMAYLHEMLDTLGLSHDYPAYTQAEDRTWLKWIGQSGPAEDLAA